MELKHNDLVKGSSGRFGDQLVYRQRGGRTIIARRPRKSTKPISARQVEVKEIFAEAVIYARGVIADESQKAVYQEKADAFRSAYNLALADFCKFPEITKWDATGYYGAVGDKITVRATDDFKVVQVSLVIKDSTDLIIEEGNAVLSGNGSDWIYTATTVNASLSGTKLILSAADLPGNVTVQEMVI